MSQALVRPAAAEVRLMLQKIKLDNIKRGQVILAESKYSPLGGGMCGGTHFVGPENFPMTGNSNPHLLDIMKPLASNKCSPLTQQLKPRDELNNEMGSFTSQCMIVPPEEADTDVDYVKGRESLGRLLERCRQNLVGLPEPIERNWKSADRKYQTLSRLTDSFETSVSENIRILQWNVLSQSLGTKNDRFVKCPESALTWRTRRYRMLEEIARHDADVICLQEVDHFTFLKNSLASLGYDGHFFPKPDSPCLYLPENTGPDGCAIFYKKDKFDLQKIHSRVIEVWTIQSNQVVLSALLRSKQTKEEVLIATTHLKARSGALLSTLRNEQGEFLLNYLSKESKGRPVIITGDFNAEPTEPVYNTLTRGSNDVRLQSAYAAVNNGKEPSYTTWKIREDGEHIQTLDYIFYSQNRLKVQRVLDFPDGQQIGINRLPSNGYCSDHFSLVADIKLSTAPKGLAQISEELKNEV